MGGFHKPAVQFLRNSVADEDIIDGVRALGQIFGFLDSKWDNHFESRCGNKYIFPCIFLNFEENSTISYVLSTAKVIADESLKNCDPDVGFQWFNTWKAVKANFGKEIPKISLPEFEIRSLSDENFSLNEFPQAFFPKYDLKENCIFQSLLNSYLVL